MIAVSAGHYPAARGASVQDFAEFPETLFWAESICAAWDFKYNTLGKAVLISPKHLRDKVRDINQLDLEGRVRLAIEVHFNAGGSATTSGCETLYCPGSFVGKKVAEIVHRAYAPTALPDRGIKEGWYRMDRPGIVDYPGDVEGDESPDYFLRYTNVPALIVEPDFIQQKKRIQTRRTAMCSAIADGLFHAMLGL